MALTVMTGQLTTGRQLTQLPVTAAPWSVELGGAGSVAATMKLDAPRVRARPELLLAVEPLRSFLAVLAGDKVLEAGPIWSHDYDDSKKQLTVRAGGLRSIFDHRLVMKILAAGEDPAATSVTLAGALADIARHLVQLLISHTGGQLPIVFGEDIGGDSTRTYAGHELSVAGDMLDNLSEVIGGPEIAFEPRLTEDRQGIVWRMRTGTTADPLLHQEGSSSVTADADWIWDSRAPRSGITGLSVKRDAGKVAYRTWATGEGTGESLLIATVQDGQMLAHDYPLLEATSAHGSVLDPVTLDQHATANLIARMRPWTTWSMSVRAAAAPRLGLYRPGDWAKVWVPKDHPYLGRYLAQGFHRTRIVKMAGDLGPTVKLDLAPTMDAR